MQALLLVLRNYLFQILYAGVGVILAAGTILTGRHMLPETDERLYEDALSIGLEMDTLGFQGYRPEKYKVRIFDGTYDFVLYDGNMTRENAAFPALAATAQEVDGEMQVIVPVYDSLKNLIDIVDTAEGAAHGETSFQMGLYTGEDHIATIWHELFHAWQSDHGFDEARIQPWADPDTGCSRNFWSRALGWWLVALADTISLMNEQIYEQYRELQELLRESVKGLLPYRDPADGLIHQVIDRADVPGNYTEASGSVMAADAILKGVRIGTLMKEKYLAPGRELFESVVENKLRDDGDGIVRLQDICHVGGLGPGNKRDGSVEYYLSEPISADDAKGVGPFMMAYAEYLMAFHHA